MTKQIEGGLANQGKLKRFPAEREAGPMMGRLRTFLSVLVALSLLSFVVYVRNLGTSETSGLTATDPSASAVVTRQESEEQEEHRKRRSFLDDACAALGGPDGPIDETTNDLIENPSRLANLIVNEERKLIYCYVPKVACTNWKRVLYILTGKTNETNPLKINADSVHRRNVFTKLSDLKPDEIRHRLKTYTKFIFVRHPIERVLSAFRNKFEKNYTSSAYFKKRFGVKIIRKYRKGIQPEDIPPSGHGVTFSEFVSYLTDTGRQTGAMNEHWAPFGSLCHPCAVRYDLIGKYETLGKDSDYILDEVGVPANIRFPEVIPSKTGSLVDSYVAQLSPRQLKRLLHLYRLDFLLFDYHYRDLL